MGMTRHRRSPSRRPGAALSAPANPASGPRSNPWCRPSCESAPLACCPTLGALLGRPAQQAIVGHGRQAQHRAHHVVAVGLQAERPSARHCGPGRGRGWSACPARAAGRHRRASLADGLPVARRQIGVRCALVGRHGRPALERRYAQRRPTTCGCGFGDFIGSGVLRPMLTPGRWALRTAWPLRWASSALMSSMARRSCVVSALNCTERAPTPSVLWLACVGPVRRGHRWRPDNRRAGR